MTEYRFTAAADRDLDELYWNGLTNFGERQADSYLDGLIRCFETLAANPRMARVRPELGKGIRIHTHQKHLIVYYQEPPGIRIVRILYAHQSFKDAL